MKNNSDNQDIISKLYNVLLERKNAAPEDSYVSSLYAKGSKKIASKIEEESGEMIAEALHLDNDAKNEEIRKALTSESADLLFHMLVMLAHHNIHPDDVLAVLEKRFGIGGHEEKASRK